MVVKPRRNRPWLFVDLRDHPRWNGSLTGIAFVLRPELVEAIEEVRLAAPGWRGRLRRGWEEFTTPEVFDYYTIHLIRGPHAGGLPLAPLVSAIGFLGAVAVCTGPLRRRRRAAAALLGLWLVCDARFTWDLAATWRVDRARYAEGWRSLAPYDALEAEYARLVETVGRVLPEGAPIWFASQGAQYRNRAAYAFFPRRVVNWLVPARLEPRYAVLFYPPAGTYDPARGLLSLRPRDRRRVKVLARPSPGAWVLAIESR